jgi:hypothetical protein
MLQVSLLDAIRSPDRPFETTPLQHGLPMPSLFFALAASRRRRSKPKKDI